MTGRRGRRSASDDGTAGQAPAARLRPMVPADLPDVIALEHELFPEDPWTPEMFADEIVQPPESRLYLIAGAAPGDGPGGENTAGADGSAGDHAADDSAAGDSAAGDR